MKQSLNNITATVDKPALLKKMIETLAYRRCDNGCIREKMQNGWEAIETSSNEAYMNGLVEFMFDDGGHVAMPFTTCFLFTCVHGKNDPYKLNWSLSLS